MIADIGRLLSLLYAAEDPAFESLAATYEVVRWPIVAAQAVAAESHVRRRSGTGTAVIPLYRAAGNAAPHKYRVQIWQVADRFREDVEQQDGSFASGVRVGRRWWHSRVAGALPTDVQSPVGDQVEAVLHPASLLSAARFSNLRASERAGRNVLAATAVPRSENADRRRLLRPFGEGADRYELEVEAETGVVLRCAASYEAREFFSITASEVAVNKVIPDEVFVT